MHENKHVDDSIHSEKIHYNARHFSFRGNRIKTEEIRAFLKIEDRVDRDRLEGGERAGGDFSPKSQKR